MAEPTHAKEYFASARVYKLKSLREIKMAIEHANRTEKSRVEVRPGTTWRDQMRWMAVGDNDAFDLVAAFKQAKGVARERKGAPLMLNIQFYVTPDWIEEAGQLHDRNNRRNKALFREVYNFAEFYVPGTCAVRLDLDEAGGGCVDVFAVPVAERKARVRKDGSSGEPIRELSANKLFEAWRKLAGVASDYSALQTLWARFAGEQLDRRLKRGRPAHETGRKHLETKEFKLEQDRLTALRVEAESTEAWLRGQRARLAAEEKALEAKQLDIEERENLLVTAETVIEMDRHDVNEARNKYEDYVKKEKDKIDKHREILNQEIKKFNEEHVAFENFMQKTIADQESSISRRMKLIELKAEKTEQAWDEVQKLQAETAEMNEQLRQLLARARSIPAPAPELQSGIKTFENAMSRIERLTQKITNAKKKEENGSGFER